MSLQRGRILADARLYRGTRLACKDKSISSAISNEILQLVAGWSLHAAMVLLLAICVNRGRRPGNCASITSAWVPVPLGWSCGQNSESSYVKRSFPMMMRLFDALVLPTVSYASETWGPFCSPSLLYDIKKMADVQIAFLREEKVSPMQSVSGNYLKCNGCIRGGTRSLA